MAKFLGPTGLTVLWSRIKAWVKKYAYITSSTSGGVTTNTITIDSKSVIVPSKTSELNNDAGFITGADIPEGAAASSATPLMDGTASAGTSNAFARGDHRHPSDTSKANKPSGTVTAGHVATLDANGNLVDSGFLGTNIGKEYKIDNSSSTPVIRDSSNNIVNSYSVITANDRLVDTSNNVIYHCFGIETNKLYFRGIGHDGEHVGGYEINTSNNELALLPDPEYLQSGDLKTVNGNNLEGTGDIKIGGKTYYVTYSSGTFTVYDSDNNLITDTSVLQEEDVLVYRYNNSEYYYYCSEVSSNTKKYITDTVPPPNDLFGMSSYQGELAGLSYDASILQVQYNNKTLKYYNSSGSTGNIVTAATIVADGGGLTSSNVGQANGVASLDSTGKVPSSQLPSYVDDVIEVYARSGQTALSQNWLATGSASGTVVSPEAGKIYVLMNSGGNDYPINSQYRWGGTTYVKLNDGGCTEMTESEMNIAVMGSDTNVWT